MRYIKELRQIGAKPEALTRQETLEFLSQYWRDAADVLDEAEAKAREEGREVLSLPDANLVVTQ